MIDNEPTAGTVRQPFNTNYSRSGSGLGISSLFNNQPSSNPFHGGFKMEQVFQRPEKPTFKDAGFLRMSSIQLQNTFQNFNHIQVEQIKNDLCECINKHKCNIKWITTQTKRTGKSLLEEFKSKFLQQLMNDLKKKWHFNDNQMDQLKVICQQQSESSSKHSSQIHSLKSLSSIRSSSPSLSKQSSIVTQPTMVTPSLPIKCLHAKPKPSLYGGKTPKTFLNDPPIVDQTKPIKRGPGRPPKDPKDKPPPKKVNPYSIKKLNGDNEKFAKLNEEFQLERKPSQTEKAYEKQRLKVKNKISALKTRIKKRECKKFIYKMIDQQQRVMQELMNDVDRLKGQLSIYDMDDVNQHKKIENEGEQEGDSEEDE